MLRITADVNGGPPIGRLFIHNTGRRAGSFWVYDAATWDGEDGTFGIEGIGHDRARPWTTLVAIALRSVPE